MERIANYVPPDVEAWNELATIVGPGRRLDPASEAELRKALSSARSYSQSLATLSANLINRLNRHNLPYSPQDLDQIAVARNRIADAISGNAKSAIAICHPIGAVPAEYGQSAIGVLPATIEKSLTLLPGATTPAP